MSAMPKARCGACLYYVKVDDVVGVCHRMPPSRGNGMPLTNAESWCGEWVGKAYGPLPMLVLRAEFGEPQSPARDFGEQ